MVKIPVYENNIDRGASNTANVGLSMQKQASDFYDGDPRAEAIQSNYKYQEDVRQSQQLAEGMIGVANGLLKLEDKISTVKADDKYIKLTSELDKAELELKNKYKGLDVEKIPQEWNNKINELYNKMIGEVPVTKRDAFDQRIAVYKSSKINNLSAYSSAQWDKTREDQHQAILNKQLFNVETDPISPTTFKSSETLGIDEIEKYHSLNNSPDEVVEFDKKDFYNKLYSTQINTFIKEKDIKSARLSFDKAIKEGKISSQTAGLLGGQLRELEREEKINSIIVEGLQSGKTMYDVSEDFNRMYKNKQMSASEYVDALKIANTIQNNTEALNSDHIEQMKSSYSGGIFAEFDKLISAGEVTNAKRLAGSLPTKESQQSFEYIAQNGFATENDPDAYSAVYSKIVATGGNTTAIYDNATKFTKQTISDLIKMQSLYASASKKDGGKTPEEKKAEWVHNMSVGIGYIKKDSDGIITVSKDYTNEWVKHLGNHFDTVGEKMGYITENITQSYYLKYHTEDGIGYADPTKPTNGKLLSSLQKYKNDSPEVVNILSNALYGVDPEKLTYEQQAPLSNGIRYAHSIIAKNPYNTGRTSAEENAIDIGRLIIEHGDINKSKEEFMDYIDTRRYENQLKTTGSNIPIDPNRVDILGGMPSYAKPQTQKEVEKLNKRIADDLYNKHRIKASIVDDFGYNNIEPYSEMSEEMILDLKQQRELDNLLREATKVPTVYEEFGIPTQEPIKEEPQDLITPEGKGQVEEDQNMTDLEEEPPTVNEVTEDGSHLCRYNYFNANYIAAISQRSPFEPATGYKVTSVYGNRLDPEALEVGIKEYKQHNGVDFGVPKNTPIYPIIDGVVTKVSKVDRYVKGKNKYLAGKYVTIRNQETGVEVMYAHLDDVNVEVGQVVKYGDGNMIGVSGNTGKSTGEHLHISVRLKGIDDTYKNCDLWGLKEGDYFGN